MEGSLMKKFISRMKSKLGPQYDEEGKDGEEEYIELDTMSGDEAGSRIVVRPFTIDDFSDVKPVLDSLREGHTICLVNIRPLKEKDLVELKRTINKLKKTTDALNGDIAGFGDDWLIVAPNFVEIARNKQTETIKEQ